MSKVENEELKPGQVVSAKVATKEVEGWLDAMRVKVRRRADMTRQIGVLAAALSYGEISIEGTVITQFLSISIGERKEIKYCNRIQAEDISVKTKALTATDPMMVSCVYVSAATGISVGEVGRMDNTDMELASVIVGFF